MLRAVDDFAVIGGGIAGASLAWRLAAHAAVVLVERESQPGYHSTGRSAAMFIETYGPPQVRALTRASRAFYERPPAGFAEHPLLAPRGAMYLGLKGQQGLLDERLSLLRAATPSVQRISASEALAMVPVLETQAVTGALLDPDAQDMDVHALHQGYLRGMRQRGGRLLTNAELVMADRAGGSWNLTLGDGRMLRAHTVINAAGAWVDAVARLAGAKPLGLQPKRRTAFTFAPPKGLACSAWPVVAGIDESFYFKPEAGALLGSPANADLVDAHDVVAEEIDVAVGIDRIQQATTLTIRRPLRAWAGLRSFVRDGELVVGWDGQRDGFFWLAAQGGYGIQTASAVAALAQALLLRRAVPPDLSAQGVDANAMSPARLQ